MNKQLTLRDYIWSVVFFLLLVCIVASFFFGVKVGRDTTEKRYEHLVSGENNLPLELETYEEQHLVSFYHTIYLPYREFKTQWLAHLDTIEVGDSTVDASDLLKELERLANRQYDTIETANIPESSPRLRQAHDQYLKSLRLFAEGLGQSSLRRRDSTDLLRALEQDQMLTQAREYALQAEESYFESFVHWHGKSDSNIELPDVDDEALPLEQWNSFSLTVKLWYITGILKSEQLFTDVYPQDIAINIEALLQNGQAERLGLTSVEEAVDMLIHTRAVRTNDFAALKNRYYSREILPQLPFFLVDND